MNLTINELVLPSLYVLYKTSTEGISFEILKKNISEIILIDGIDFNNSSESVKEIFYDEINNLHSQNVLQRSSYATYVNEKYNCTQEGVNFLMNEENITTLKSQLINEDALAIESLYQKFIESEDNIIDENIEGVESVDNISPGEDNYPTSLHIERTQFSIFELKRKFEKNQLVLDPEYQRNKVWKAMQKAELIESILMNIPLPFLYLAEKKKGNLVVIDGRQRLSALFEYLDNKFSLGRNLKILSNLKNKKFSDLDPIQQGTIEDYQLITHIIKPPTSDRIMIDIFDRVNRGGTKLNHQEIRNALYQGYSTKLLKKLAESDSFLQATNYSIKTDRMKDRYIILRALSFYIWKKKYNPEEPFNGIVDYKGDTDNFLSRYMEYINQMSESELQSLENMFLSSVQGCYEVLGEDVFRLPRKKEDAIKRAVNMALFESIIYLFADVDYENETNKQILKRGYKNLMGPGEFLTSFLSIDSTVKMRFSKIDVIKNETI